MTGSGRDALRLAIVGATGVIGSQLLELIDERAFPFSELRLFGSESGSGQPIEVAGQERRVDTLADPSELADLDVVFLAVPRGPAELIASASPGPILIDLSACFAPPSTLPIVAPGFTSRDQVNALSAGKLLHLPNPVALALATILNALDQPGFVHATVMLSASATGKQATTNLVQQSADLLSGRLDLEDEERQYAFNILPFAGEHEISAALTSQVERLLGKAPLMALQVVHTPILHGTAISLGLAQPLAEPGDLSARLRRAPGILLVEGDEPPGVVEAIGQEALLIGTNTGDAGYSVWCTFDNARRTALAALWSAECLLPSSGKNLT